MVLRVADTGTGMDEDTRERAIEPFFSNKAVGQGTGRGLSMAHGLSLQLGGAMTIDSAVGIGAVVEFRLRRARASPGWCQQHLLKRLPSQVSRC